MRLPNGMRVSTVSDLGASMLYREIFVERFYDGFDLPNDATVFDVGANIGLFGLWIRDRCRSASIHCFEPSPATFRCLRANLRGFYALNQIALGSAGRQAVLTHYPWLPELSTLHPRLDAEREARTWQRYFLRLLSPWLGRRIARWAAWLLHRWFFQPRKFSCQVASLSDYLRQHPVERIDLLKCDVEKSEEEVLDGIDPEHWPLIRQLALEAHLGEPQIARLTERMRDKGFTIERRVSKLFPDQGVDLLLCRRPK